MIEHVFKMDDFKRFLMQQETKKPEAIHVYNMGDGTWVAADTLLNALTWYNENVTDIEVDYLNEMRECDIDTEGTWWETDAPEDKERIGEEHTWSRESDKRNFGDLIKTSDGIFKYTSFREVINSEGYTEPYVISAEE